MKVRHVTLVRSGDLVEVESAVINQGAQIVAK